MTKPTIEKANFVRHIPCEVCGSKDNNALFDNDTTYCFSEGCDTFTSNYSESENQSGDEDLLSITKDNINLDLDDIKLLKSRNFTDRGIPKEITEFFDVKSKRKDGVITHHFYPYTKDGSLSAYKIRTTATKDFRSKGDMKDVELFGQSKFMRGGKILIITEGELDAMTVATVYNNEYKKIYPVVSVPTGAASATKSILKNIEWIKSFNEVVLMFDMDEAGQNATSKVAKAIGINKVKVAKFDAKDPNESYLKNGKTEILSQTYNAEPWCAPGVINNIDEIKRQYLENRNAVYVPWPPFVEQLNNKIYGRRYNSLTMFTSGTGCGKTTFFREDMFHVLNITDHMVGICSLEESIAETVRGIISLQLNIRVGLPDSTKTTEEEELTAIDKAFNDERIMILEHQGCSSSDDIVEKIEFMAASGCKFIYLDHITICTSLDDGDTNKNTDKLMNNLSNVAQKFKVWIGVISHLRKTSVSQTAFESGGEITMDHLKGSGSLKQIPAQVISLTRNLGAEDEYERHVVHLSVLKDRFSGYTGPTCRYKFGSNGRLAEATDVNPFKPVQQ